jgi:hypothetical protein
VLERIPGEATEHQRRVVTLAQCGVPVRVLVRHHGKEQNGDDENKQLELVQMTVGFGVWSEALSGSRGER